MKKIFFLLLTLACSMTELKAQQAEPFAANTGDTEMNGVLKDVNTNAKKDMNVFTNDISTKFGVPKGKIEQANKIMNPGDVFMAAQVASATNKPFDEVTKTFQAHKDKGWGEIAKELGIKPGSPEFHAMKKSMKSHGNSNGKGHGNSGKGDEHGKNDDNDHGKGSENGNSGKHTEKEKNK